jgi:hypothetical protein
LFYVADRLGKTVAELEETLGVHELSEWAAFYHLERNPPKQEPFYSKDPKVMADKMREVLGVKPMRRK